MYELYHNHSLTASDIITLLDIDKGYLSRILKNFEKDKMVSKAKSTKDKRASVLCLTDKGKAAFEVLNHFSEKQVERIFEHLTESDCKELVQKMKEIQQLINKKMEEMAQIIDLSDIRIRTTLKPGDLGFVIHRHGRLYSEEYNYGISFETYVGAGMYEFYQNYNPEMDRVWICEHGNRIIGFVLLMHRENNTAQLRYLYLEPEYRGIGLGKKLMQLYMDFMKEKGYQSSHLWTTHELHTAASLYQRHGFRLTEEKQSTAFGKPLREQRYDLLSVR